MAPIEISPCWTIIYWIVASFFTLFYTIYAFKIHLTSKLILKAQRDNGNYAWFMHQGWFNFVGCAIGWIILWILFPELVESIKSHSLESVTFIDFLFLLTSILGITGYLPLTLYGIAASALNTINKLFSSN